MHKLTDAQINEWFTYHSPEGNQVERYQRLREAAKVFASFLIANVPQGADLTASLRKLRECAMTANAAIALEEFPGRGTVGDDGTFGYDRLEPSTVEEAKSSVMPFQHETVGGRDRVVNDRVGQAIDRELMRPDPAKPDEF